jgi:hypothetical protein
VPKFSGSFLLAVKYIYYLSVSYENLLKLSVSYQNYLVASCYLPKFFASFLSAAKILRTCTIVKS